MDVASLQILIKTQGVEAAQRELDKLSGTAGKAEKSVGGLASSMKTLGAIASLGAMATLAKEYAQVADAMKLLEARIKLVSNASENYASIQKNMTVIANENGVSIKEIGNLYTKLSMSLKPLGITTNSVMQVTDAFSKTLLISGASISEASSATQQFAQAMASGRLQGDEFRSMAENSPRFMKAMTDALGKTSAEIRQMAEDGKLTSSIVGGALIDSMAKLREEARNMPMTIGKALNELKNEATLTAEQFDKLTGTNETIAKGFQSITEKVIKLREELPKMSAEMQEWEKKNEKGLYTLKVVGGAVIDAIATGGGALYEFEKQWFKQSIEGALQTAGTIGEVTGIATDATIKAKKENDILLEGLAKTLKEIDKQAQAKKDAEKDKVAKEEFNNINPTKEQVKNQLKEWEAYHKAIGNIEEALQFKRLRYAEEYKTLNASQIDEMIEAEKNKSNKIDKTNSEQEKLAKEWAKRKIEIATNIAIAEQDELAKPFIELEAKYKEDMEYFKGNKEAQLRITDEYNAKGKRLQEDLTKKFNEEEDKKAKKTAEWQIKIFEANEKLNDEIIKMHDEMYGTDTSIEKWYDNQLENLGKLSQEAGATAEELQTLLDKIETLKAMKLQKQTISFKIEQSFYSSFENNLASSIEDAFNGTLNFKKFFKNIGNDLMKTFSSSLASVGTNMLRGNYSALAALGGGAASLVGTSISASDISGIMNSGGTFDSASNTITTSGGTKIGLNESGGGSVSSTGSDIMSLVSTVSTLKTAYTVATQGLTGMFNGLTGAIDSGLGFMGIGGSVGAGGLFVNPLTGTATSSAMGAGAFVNPATLTTQSTMASGTAAAQGASYGTIAGGALVGGAVGYGAGALGDAMFGAKTYAPVTGAIGGAAAGGLYAAGMISGPVGWAVLGASLLLGGLFGKKKTTDVGYQFFDNMTALDEITTSTVQQYSDWKKKSWFSSKSGTSYSNISSKEMKQIESVFDTYDYLLGQLGDTDKIFLSAGKYTGATFGDELSKNFISLFTDIPRFILQEIEQSTDDVNSWQDRWEEGGLSNWFSRGPAQWFANAQFDEIYQAWVDYAEAVDKTVMEAFTESVSSFITSKRTFELWSLGDSIESLAKRAEFATADLDLMKNSMGATGVTVESFLNDFNNAVKTNFTPETITQWESLGNALMTATDATNAYKSALEEQAKALANFIKASNDFISNFDIWSANNSGNTIEGLKTKADYLQSSFSELEKSMGLSGITVDNFKSTYNKLAYTNGVINQEMVTDLQSLGTALMTATDAQKAYTTALEQQATALLVQNETVYQNILTSFSAISELNTQIADIQLEQALISKGITKDNLTALEAQKSGIQTIMDMATNMRDKLINASNITSVYKSVLESARIDFSKGDYSSDNISRLGEVSELYSESLKKYALSEADYKLGVLSIANEIESITGKTTTLADVENEIERVTKALEALEPTLESQLSALELQRDTYVFQTDRQIATLETLLGSSSPMVQMLQVAISSLGKGATTNISGSTLVGSTLSNVADIYSKLGLNQYQTDTSGYEYWTNQVNSGAIAAADLETAIKTSAAQILGTGFASGGYTGNMGVNDIAGVVHGQEYVVNAQTTKDLGLNGGGGAFADMVAELASLKKLMVKLVSDNTKQLSTQRAILGEKVAI